MRPLSTLIMWAALATSLAAAPTMASLKAKRAYVRTGPGKCYPIKWILIHPTTPLKIIEAFDVWRHVEDPLGGRGWIHKSLLWPKPFVYVTKDTFLRTAPHESAPPRARVEKGAFLLLRRSDAGWLYVSGDGFRGYVPQEACWSGPLYALARK